VAAAKEVPEAAEVDLETERLREERAGASNARGRDISLETAVRREETAETDQGTAAEGEVLETIRVGSESQLVLLLVGMEMTPAPPAKWRKILRRE
jgi:hypothetical protein